MSEDWFAVRCVFDHGVDADGRATIYEERVTLWRTVDLGMAIELAEGEAAEYVSDLTGTEFIGLSQAYHLADPPGHGAEVFSLMRDSSLSHEVYLDTFFSTGAERSN
jgi:hypothetical protein